jgi:beta-mannosidase
MDLSGTWRAAIADDDLRRSAFALEFDDREWEPIEVPGHWRSTPAFAENDEPLIYRTHFDLDAGGEGARHWVVLDGLFYQGDVWLDGAYLGDSEGYFSLHAYEITELARLAPEHVLAIEVTCDPPSDRTKKRAVTGVFQQSDQLDPQWNPGGLWRPVRIERSGPVRIARVRVLCTEASADRAQMQVTAELDSDVARTVRVRTTVDDRVERDREFPLARGVNQVEWTFGVDNPALWWPWSLGDQPLSTVTVSVRVDHQVSDARVVRTGFRQVSLRNWILSVNGERLFVKGANLNPTRQALAEATSDELRTDVLLARDAGLDLIRLEAHVSRPELYEAADETGVLVWQDFPLQGGYARSVRREAVRQVAAAVDVLGHHPSIVAWCGHNEPIAVDTITDHREDRILTARYVAGQELPTWNRSVLDRSVKRAFERADGSRPVIAHSGVVPHPPQLDGTTSHLWFGWYYGEASDLDALAAAAPRLVRFVAEFGAQSVPENAAFMEPERWPDLDWDRLAGRHNVQPAVFERRVPPTAFATFEEWRRATQRYHASLLKRQIEQLRRLKYRPTGGFTVSSLADAHPAVTTAVLGHDREPKPAHQALVDACRPVIVVADHPPASVRPGAAIGLDVHVVSDLHQPIAVAEIVARLTWPGGRHGWRWRGEIPADACVRAGMVSFVVPETAGPLTLDLELVAGELAATNRYVSMITSDSEAGGS